MATKRPTYNAASFPPPLRPMAVANAARQWVWQSPDAERPPIWVPRERAEYLHGKFGGQIWPPENA